ncbi:lig_chan-Glu_bd domain-containing protein [Nephila pilipes]|uniref:Lig_chan-Glu_bd domain-containing protein n=1 Tax=Nephila pilipes TaxID=299642 RepID=A0A8X6JIH4_NEPPI|nr:lig_chan-Glu_bd domain-containing protein [Nephila pilipes]
MSNFNKWTIATLNRSRLFEIYSNSDGMPNIYGIEAELIKTIMTKLNVKYEIVTPADEQYGIELKDGNWTGIIGMLHKGEADIGIANLGIYEDRYRTVDFTVSYMIEGMHFCLLKSAYRDELFVFLHLFDFSTWMFLLGSLLITATVILNILKERETFSSIILYLFGSLLSQTLIFHKKIYNWKIIFMSWLVFAFVMSSAYSGALLSFLTLPSEAKTVETFRELADAVAKGSHRVYSLRGAQSILLLRNAAEPHLQFLGNIVIDNDWFITADEMTRNPLKKKVAPVGKPKIDVVFGGFYIFKLLYGVGDFKSKVFVSEEKSIMAPMAIAFRKGFCCSSEVNKVLTRILSAGIYEKFLRDESLKYWFSLSSDERKEMENKEDRSISVNDLAEAFVLLSVGLLISILVFLIEIALSYIKC